MPVEKTYATPRGDIHYAVYNADAPSTPLVFLPGLTADRRLFEKQLAFFTCPMLVWDAPGHAASRPFRLGHTLMDEAVWLHDILLREGFQKPVLVGQSMGGYVSQCYLERFPADASAFVSIDSAPIQRKYMTGVEIFLLRHMRLIYRLYPWRALQKAGADGCAMTPYGRDVMRRMLADYTHAEYADLAAAGFRRLADAVDARLPYLIPCPTALICGELDKAGSAKRYNLRWAKETGFALHMIPGAGHNANTDAPEAVNAIIASMCAPQQA